MLHKLLTWINDNEDSTLFKNQIVTQLELEKENVLAKEMNRRLVAEARVARFSGLEQTTIPSNQSTQLKQHKILMSFIEFCKSTLALSDDKSSTLFLIALKYLLATHEEEQEVRADFKITQLFTALLQEDKAKTLEFYEQNGELFSAYPKVNLMVDTELAIQTVKEHLAYLTQELIEQKNPLGISTLFRDSIDNPEKLAALLLWLLQRGISPEAVIQTQLLHDFMGYNLYNLDSTDCPIKHLYVLLGQFPEADELVSIAGNVSCEERGFERYALNGIIWGTNQLSKVAAKPLPLQFTPTAKNFAALHALFGQPFLLAAIHWCATSNNKTWSTLLNRCLNQPSMVAEPLPTLINLIAMAHTELLETLADLIDESTAEQLVSLHSGAALHLLRYKPALFDKINAINVVDYIHQMNSSNSSGLDVIAQLMAMFIALLKRKHSSVGLVFETIIDKLFMHSQVLDDTELVRHLKRYPEGDLLLTQRCKKLQQQIDDSIAEQTLEAPLSIHNYQIIEDTWLEASRKLQVLSELIPKLSFELHDKYALYARVAKVSFMRHGHYFNVDAFIQTLSLSDVKFTDGISEYERVLIEILTTIDEKSIRTQIIEKLENKPIEHLDWMDKDYGSNPVFIKAAQQGNIGLLKFLETKSRQNKTTVNTAILIAAKADHWDIVDHLHSNRTKLITEKTITTLLTLAAKQGQLSTVQQLCDFNIKPIHNKVIEQALEQAVINGHFNIVKYLGNLSVNTPSKKANEILLKIAIKLEHLTIIKYLCSLPNAPHQLQIEKEFEQAATQDRLHLAQCLYSLLANTPRQIVLERVFKKIVKLGYLNLVQFFVLCQIIRWVNPSLKML